jgi:hypothetical protein
MIWRSDLHALRPGLPIMAVIALLLAMLCLLRARTVRQ